MGHMVAELLGKSPLLALPIVSVVLFVLVFGSICIRVIRAGRHAYDDAAVLPLEKETSDE